MSANHDPRIDAYIEKAAPFARPILKHIRSVVHQACPESVETVKWGMPFFMYRSGGLCHLAGFKAHCAFGFWHHEMEKVLADAGYSDGSAMGNFGRIAALTDLPPKSELIRLIKTAMKLTDSGRPARARTAARAANEELPIPAELAAALKKNKAAAATFEAFAPSHRKEYITWITEAKRDETRAKRLATTVECLAAGKSRHWKYDAD
jgi:uncharacterized protein YdeI (YjbR/CyaY-like superfamily)